MVGGGVALGLAVLRHDVADVKLLRVGRADGVGHAVDKQIRDHARIKTSRAEQNEVGLRNGTERVGQRLWVLRHERNVVDAAVLLLFRVEDVRFAHNARAVFKHGLELYIRVRHRQHAARDRQYLSHHGDGLFKAPRHAVERRKQQVSERLPLELSLGKAIAEKLLHHRLGVRERLHTLPHVTRRQNTHFTAQHAAPAAVVRHCDDGRQAVCIFFQPSQHGRQARAAADGGDLRPRGAAGGRTTLIYHREFPFKRIFFYGKGSIAGFQAKWKWSSNISFFIFCTQHDNVIQNPYSSVDFY